MTRPNSRRPMSRAAYQREPGGLESRAPMAGQAGGFAPGHFGGTGPFVGQCELPMKPADYRHLPLFCATNQRDKSACGWNWWAPA